MVTGTLPHMQPVICVEQARLAYGDHIALDGADLDVAPGTLTTLIGPNGSGKSTLLDAVAGLITPVSGTVRTFEPGTDRPARVAYVMQQTRANALLPLSAIEVVRMGRYALRGMFGRFRAADHEAVERAMVRLEVDGIADRQLRELSGGQRQRVLMAQGVAQEAPALLLDEPVTGLALVSRRRITEVVEEELERGTAVVVSTHDLRDAEVADHVVLLAGRVVACGPPGEVLTADNLRQAYGGRFIQLSPDDAGVDEHVHPHHHHVQPTRQDADQPS